MKKIICSLLVMISSYSHAELVSVGGGEGVYDTDTGVTWSSFEKTIGFSLPQLQDAMEYGGELYGWKLADSEDVYTLWSNNVPRYNEVESTSKFSFTVDERQQWIEMFGTTYKDNRSSSYYYDNTSGLWRNGGYYRDGMLNFYGEGHSADYTYDVEHGTYSDAYGYYLVLDDGFEFKNDGSISNVPVSGLAFALPLALGLFGMRRKRVI